MSERAATLWQACAMPREGYVKELRDRVGSMVLLLPSAAAMIRRDDGRILVGRHADIQRWVLPGGGVDPGERPADTAVRESWEEVHMVVEIVGLRGTYGGGAEHRVSYPNGDACDYVVTVFDAVPAAGEAPAPSAELTELRWVTEDELADLDIPPWFRAVLRHPRGWEPPSWQPLT